VMKRRIHMAKPGTFFDSFLSIKKYLNRELRRDMREEASEGAASSLNTSISSNEKKKFYFKKMWLCALMVYLSYVLIYSSRNLLNGIIIARQRPIAKCFTITFIILPITLIMSVLVRKWLSKYSIQRMMTYALGVYCLYFLFVNPALIYFKKRLDVNEFLVADLIADGKVAYKRARFCEILFCALTSWTVTLQFSMINIYESFVQYVLMFSVFNEIFTQKQYNGFVSIIVFCETVSLLTSSILSLMHQQIIASVEYYNKEYVNMTFSGISAALCLTLFSIFAYLRKTVESGRTGSLQRSNVVLHVETPEDDYDSVRDRSLLSLLRLKFVRAISINVITLFILNEFIYISFESGVYTKAKKTFKHVTSSVIKSTDIIRIVSALLILLSLLMSVPRWLIQNNWKFLAYSPCVWMIMVSIVQFTMDTILKGVDNDGFQFVSRAFQSLKSDKNVDLRRCIYGIYNTFTITALIIVRYFRNIGFLITKETLTMMIDSKIRPRLRTIYDGMCPLIGKAIASCVVLFTSELLNFSDARSFSIVVLVFALVVFYFWMKNTRYLVKRYYELF
ncbi:ATP:ADP Antiporter (AAA) Family, partial [Trachipleistophora hominis]